MPPILVSLDVSCSERMFGKVDLGAVGLLWWRLVAGTRRFLET